MYSARTPDRIDRLHWLLCGMEGGFLLNSQLLAEKGEYDRQQLSDLWSANMFTRFKYHHREPAMSQRPERGDVRLKNKWISEPKST